MEILRCIDPQAVQLRALIQTCMYIEIRKEKTELSYVYSYVVFVHIFAGPNYLWHMDGNDKLKPYGFSIHGCIDGSVL